MKKIQIISAIVISAFFVNKSVSIAEDNVIKIEVPASVEKVDIKYENKSPSVLDKSIYKTKTTAKKTAAETKKITKKTVEATKSAAKKTKEGTKEIIDDINLQRVTSSELEKKSEIKKLKQEQKALKAAYNSRIKDIKAKIKVTEQSTVSSDVKKRNKIYSYEKQIIDLEQQRDSAVKKYDSKINQLKNHK